jgi:hypothetical protein
MAIIPSEMGLDQFRWGYCHFDLTILDGVITILTRPFQMELLPF